MNQRSIRSLFVIVLVIFASFIFSAVAFAQEATEEPAATETATAPPIVINVETPPAPEAESPLATVLGYVAVGIFLGGLGYHLLFAKTDAERVAAIEAARNDRTGMEYAERSYQRASAMQQQVISTVIGLLKSATPFIPGKADETLVELLEDIQKEGPPTAVTS